MGNNIKRFEELEIQDDFISVIMRNRCVQDLELPLKDDTVKIILNTKGILDDVSIEMKSLLDYIDGKEPEDDFTRELDDDNSL